MDGHGAVSKIARDANILAMENMAVDQTCPKQHSTCLHWYALMANMAVDLKSCCYHEMP